MSVYFHNSVNHAENADMLKIKLLFIAAVALAGCASFYENQESAFQQRVPQLVADCNDVFSGDDRPASWDGGVKACKQLSERQRLGLVEPETMKAYTAYQSSRTDRAGVPSPFPYAPALMVPYPLPQVQ